jgi:hypothetical protein
MSDKFPIQNGQKQIEALPLWFFNFALCREEGPRKPGGDETEWTTSTSGLHNLCSFIG